MRKRATALIGTLGGEAVAQGNNEIKGS